MSLSKYVAEKKTKIYEELRNNQPPSEGDFDMDVFKEGCVKGKVQMGTVRYEPSKIFFEYIYPDTNGSSTVLVVTLKSPERIVYLPVPNWVVEHIWQGEVTGSCHFERDALHMVGEYQKLLDTDRNIDLFGSQQAKRRE